jgi:hypothetical protein
MFKKLAIELVEQVRHLEQKQVEKETLEMDKITINSKVQITVIALEGEQKIDIDRNSIKEHIKDIKNKKRKL